MPEVNHFILALALWTAAGCARERPAAVPAKPDLAQSGTKSVLDFPADAKFAPESTLPRVCEVEISGRVVVPKEAGNVPPPLTVVAIGDCLAPEPDIVGFGGSTNGRFFVEVFVPWGSDLTICAASEPTPGAASRLYGKSPLLMHAEKTGEVEFKDVVIEVKPAGVAKKFEHRAGVPRGR